MVDFTAARELLQGAESILITTHINPDGDAIGSSLALYNYAISIGKTTHIIISESNCPNNYKFLANSKKIKSYSPEKHNNLIANVDAIFVLDASELSRIKTMENAVRQSQSRKVLIDHHISPEIFADVTLSLPSACSTGELIYYFIKQAKGKIDKNIAEALYVAIYTDTGGFRFSTTTSGVHKIIAELLECGADPNFLYDSIYNTNSLALLKLHGLAISELESYLNNQLTILSIPNELFRLTGTNDKDTEGLSQVTLSVGNTQVGVLLVDSFDKQEIRVSLRSKGNINVREIAAKYGGGGHLNASGCRLHDTSLLQAKEIMINEIANVIGKK